MIAKWLPVIISAGAAVMFLFISQAAWPAADITGASNSKVARSSKAVPAPAADALRARITRLAQAASSGNAKQMSSFWLPDGIYIDTAGGQMRGRDSIARRFGEALRLAGRWKVVIEPQTVRPIADNAAWIEGVVRRQTAYGLMPSTRFTMLMEKRDGDWFIASATETDIATHNIEDRLSMLNWLVGEWVAERDGTRVNMVASWAGNRSFLVCDFVVDVPGEPKQHDRQVIGWDPTSQEIVSWSFDANGGFGHGIWSRRGRQWLVESEGVDETGARTAAINIISAESKDSFSWQSVDRSVNGVPIPDSEPLTVRRIASKQTSSPGRRS